MTTEVKSSANFQASLGMLQRRSSDGLNDPVKLQALLLPAHIHLGSAAMKVGTITWKIDSMLNKNPLCVARA